MAPPSAVIDLTSSAINSSLSKHNATASNAPAIPLPTTKEPQLADLDPRKLKVTLTASPKAYDSTPSDFTGDDHITDHWITAKWSSTKGWEAPELRPYSRMDIWPTASCLHYATECFEGLKVYRGYDNKIRLFRPSRNAARMLISSTRIACPSFSPNAFEELVKILVSYEAKKWLPEPGTFVYIRPTMIGTGKQLGMMSPTEAMLFIVIARFPRIDVSLKLLASKEDTIRAWPGGFGYAKVGANYGPSLLANQEARSKGFHQVLWLFGKESLVTEAGAANFFAVFRDKHSNKLQLTTAPLDDKIILDGVTRRSVIELARERLATSQNGHEALEVVERWFGMQELVEAHAEGRLVEAFAVGTAYFVAPIELVHFRGNDIVPLHKQGPYMEALKGWMKDIMYGNETHEWGVVVEEKEWVAEAASDDEVGDLMRKIKELKKQRGWEAALEKVKIEEEESRA